jgi:hypothetical protein
VAAAEPHIHSFALQAGTQKYSESLARTDLKNDRISTSGGFQACYEIIRGVVGGLIPALNLSISNSETHPLGKMSNPAGGSRAPHSILYSDVCRGGRRHRAPRGAPHTCAPAGAPRHGTG